MIDIVWALATFFTSSAVKVDAIFLNRKDHIIKLSIHQCSHFIMWESSRNE